MPSAERRCMPPLTFLPQYDRHALFAAAGRCLQEYEWMRQEGAGQFPPADPGKSLLVGLGMDLGISMLWQQTAAGMAWNVQAAVEAVVAGMPAEARGASAVWEVVSAEVVAGVQQYAVHWQGVRQWKVLAVHPYLHMPTPMNLLLHPSDVPYLTMPDYVAEDGGVTVVVDVKTGAYPYEHTHYLWEPQMLVNCLPWVQRGPVAYQIDYCQRPRKSGQWIFPATPPMFFTPAKEQLARAWLSQMAERKSVHLAMQARGDDLRNPDACRRWYGRCGYWEKCFQE